VAFTAFTSTSNPIIARLIVRRVRDRNHQDTLFPVWRYHPFFTNNTEPTAQTDLTHEATQSSRQCSPTSSTVRWHTYRRGASRRTRPGRCAQR
jgi:hypothetical protein